MKWNTYVIRNLAKAFGRDGFTAGEFTDLVDRGIAPTDKSLIGQHAQRLIDDPVLALAFDKVERDLTATWRNSPLGQKDQREEAYKLIWALAQVRTKLLELLADKKMMEAEEKRLQAERERAA